jgi:ferredoxin
VTGKFQVRVDPARCQAYGLCVGIQPDVFDIPAGAPTVILLRDIVDADDREDAAEAVRNCPAQALALSPVPDR